MAAGVHRVYVRAHKNSFNMKNESRIMNLFIRMYFTYKHKNMKWKNTKEIKKKTTMKKIVINFALAQRDDDDE